MVAHRVVKSEEFLDTYISRVAHETIYGPKRDSVMPRDRSPEMEAHSKGREQREFEYCRARTEGGIPKKIYFAQMRCLDPRVRRQREKVPRGELERPRGRKIRP